jgi:hypothetical protein
MATLEVQKFRKWEICGANIIGSLAGNSVFYLTSPLQHYDPTKYNICELSGKSNPSPQ